MVQYSTWDLSGQRGQFRSSVAGRLHSRNHGIRYLGLSSSLSRSSVSGGISQAQPKCINMINNCEEISSNGTSDHTHLDNLVKIVKKVKRT